MATTRTPRGSMRLSSLRRVGAGMVVDGDEHAPIALTPQQPNVDAVVHAAVQLAHRRQELGVM
jgi:hypothetical protein